MMPSSASVSSSSEWAFWANSLTVRQRSQYTLQPPAPTPVQRL